MKETIVIVDADLTTRLTLKKLLIEENYDVVSEGKDGFEAIDMCKSKRPDLLIINAELPVLNGIKAGKKIIIENYAKAVIYLCNDCDEMNKTNLDRINSNRTIGWVPKPVHKEVLLSTICLGMEKIAYIEQLEEEVVGLNKKLGERKIIEKAKGILMEEQRLNESEAYKFIQRLSMQKQTSMAEIADLILLDV
ncbi:ANTAR domain-containing protein [Desemzia sp. C1]|uniref:ANTAR domain-containing response regulator n=1 Tax=Desemzia sp. C1 TaxID=2892016 RepID=UPI001E44D485|nr:ANTAR domain-containing protein [Desemzia sp. C1]MCI3029292.1 ANTAR domain-containing protein [Desemzia sp. C1]